MPEFARRNKSLRNTFFVQFGWRPVQGPVWHFGVRRDVLFRKDTMFCYARAQCSFSQRHNVLFRKDTMFCFATTQCSVCRKHNVPFTIYSVACSGGYGTLDPGAGGLRNIEQRSHQIHVVYFLSATLRTEKPHNLPSAQ